MVIWVVWQGAPSTHVGRDRFQSLFLLARDELYGIHNDILALRAFG